MNDFFYVPYMVWGEVTYHAVPVRMGRAMPGTALYSPRRMARWITIKTGFD